MEFEPCEDRYVAAMILGGAGDAIGFKKGDWENSSTDKIHKELKTLGGLKNLHVKKPDWIISDDTIMHLATAESLVRHEHNKNKETLMMTLARKYKESMNDMKGRNPGITCKKMCEKLNPPYNYRISFSQDGGGCGAAMRSMCIGLRYPRPSEIDNLIEVSIEAGRMTHHHPSGYLGSLASALFTSFAIQKRPIHTWGFELMMTLEQAKAYIQSCKDFHVEDNLQAWPCFVQKWEYFLNQRCILDGKSQPRFLCDYEDAKKRDHFYMFLSFNNCPGASGYDAPMIAYDAMLACQGDWEKLCDIAMFHGGDSDSTGIIAGCLYGAVYGFDGVPRPNFEQLEYREKLEQVAKKLHAIVVQSSAKSNINDTGQSN